QRSPPRIRVGQTISLKFSLSGNGTIDAAISAGEENPPTISLFIQRKGDNYSGAGPYKFYRYFSRSRITLGSASDYELKVPLIFENWSDVGGPDLGVGTPDTFKACVDNAEFVGFTFGGKFFAGHGQRVRDGQVRFTLKEYSF